MVLKMRLANKRLRLVYSNTSIIGGDLREMFTIELAFYGELIKDQGMLILIFTTTT
jgi:hypothetical protein